MNITAMASALGKKGGKTTLKKHGKAHFSNAGKIGMEKRWRNHVKRGDK